MNILGLSCYYHDSAASLVKDGKIIAAAQEERFNRVKNSSDFPVNALNYCIQAGGISFDEIDYIAFYEKPYLKFYRVILEHLKSWPFSLRNFLNTMPNWLQDRLILPLTLEREIGYRKKVFFVKHHLSHAASAFLASPFEKAAILTADAIGEWATMSYGWGRGASVNISKEMLYPESLGLIYTAVTTYLGFEAHEGEGKVMGLAGCGKPVYLDKFKKIVSVKKDGSFKIDKGYFGFNKGPHMYSRRFEKLFGKHRVPNTDLAQRHCDIAASLQAFTEKILIVIVRSLYKETGMDNLCLAGGLFLNCAANYKILEKTPFKNIFIQPAAGDAGGSLGAALYTYNSVLKKRRNYVMSHAYLGPEFSRGYIKRILVNSDISFKELPDGKLARYIAKKISEDNVIGWFQGKMEFGPRALGNRSILANPCNPDMKYILNSRVKKRESFRPYAPAVLEERFVEYFKLQRESPFMLLAPPVREEKKKFIPAVTHVDSTARVQTVKKDDNILFWHLIKEFENITGIPMVINTSFNMRGEPIVCTPEDAISCFRRSGMDYLVLGNYVIGKANEIS
jgi:carbamoyltransferase